MKTARLIVADSEKDANMLYATGLFVPDPFIYFEWNGRTCAVLGDLEIDRAKKNAAVDRVLSYNRYQKQAMRAGIKAPRLSDVLKRVLRDHKIRAVEVPANFPLGLAKRLRGVRVTAKPDPFFPARELKTRKEVNGLSAALRLAEEGMIAAIDALQASRIGGDGCLYHQKRKLTAEHIQGVINANIAGMGGVACHTIVACGNQACDPHEAGHGPLRAHQTIIIDIFPRDMETGFYGDITRTVVRGRASEQVRKMFVTVSRAQDLALSKLRDGVDGQEIHRAIHDLFKKEGFKTGRNRGRMQGFFHGTGHGLGLDIHEAPRIAPLPCMMRAGHVVTVEPGLYYRGVGGVRLEDVALVRKRDAKNLTQFPKFLEI